MRSTCVALAAFVCLVCCTTRLSAEETSPRELVEQLGRDEFVARREAADQLVAIGLDARQALEDGLQHADPEIRRSSRRILSDLLNLDHQQRVQAFVDDSEGKHQHDLPGWQRFQQVVGDDKDARALFVKMQQAEEGLLASLQGEPEAIAQSLDVRYRVVIAQMSNQDPRRRRQPSLGTIAALLFVATDESIVLSPQIVNHHYWYTLVQQQAIRDALQKGPMKAAAHRLVGAWLTHNDSGNLAQNKLQLAIRYQIKGGIQLAMNILANDKLSPYYRVSAMHALGQLGGKEYAQIIAESIDDKAICSQRTVLKNKKRTIIKTELRDVALAWLIQLTEQNHKDYGFPNAHAAFQSIKKNPTSIVSVYQINFDSAAQRTTAFEKWNKWAQSHPLPSLPEGIEEKWKLAQSRKNTTKKAVPIPQVNKDDSKVVESALPASLQYDRQMARKLSKARELIAAARISEAAVLLGKVLEVKEDYVYKPDRRLTLSIGIRAEAERLLGLLPREGIAEYRRYFGHAAKAELENAVASGRIEDVDGVARRYFHTTAGQHAAYLVAVHNLNQNEALTAAFLFQRIQRRSLDVNELEPGLSLQLAAAWYLAGMIDKAEMTLLQMQERFPGSSLDIAGRSLSMFTSNANALAWLREKVDLPQAAPSAAGWLLYRGGPTRNMAVDDALPYLQPKLLSSIIAPGAAEAALEKLVQQRRKGHRALFPTMHPLCVGNTLITRTATSICAIDLVSGDLLWESRAHDALADLVGIDDKPTGPQQEEMLADGLERRVWDDHTYGTISTNGQLVYVIEDVPFGVGADYQRLVMTPSGRRQLDVGALKDFSVLTAYDLKTGKVRWETGGPSSDESVRDGGLFFLGPPLPIGGKIYVVAREKKRTRLLELDANSGNLLWDMTLAEREQIPQQHVFPTMPLSVYEQRAHRSGASPSSAEGVLVCPLSDGDYVGVDLTTRTVLWVYRSPMDAVPINPMFGNVFQQQMLADAYADPDDRWVDSSVTIAEGRVLITPAASGKLICLDLSTGNMVWAKTRGDGFYVAGIRDGKVVIVGRSQVRALRLDNGESAWEHHVPLPAGAVPTGRCMLSEAYCYLPLSTGEVAAYDLATGDLIARSHATGDHVPGNLMACDAGVISQTAQGVFRYPLLKQREDELRAALKADPEDKEILAQLGEVLLFSGNVAQAVEHLSNIDDQQNATQTRTLLASALLHGVRSDLERFAKLAARADSLIEDPAMRVKYLRELAAAHERRGDVKEAFETYLRIMEQGHEMDTLEHVAASRAVRRDRWLVARLDELWQIADADTRQWIVTRFQERVEDDTRDVLKFFPAHPAAEELRLQLAIQEIEQSHWNAAEQMLLSLLRTAKEDLKSEVVMQLARNSLGAGKPDLAAAYYQQLRQQYGERRLRNGKTGREICDAAYASEAPPSAVDYLSAWPVGDAKSTSKRKGRSSSYYYPIRVVSDHPWVPLSSAVRVDSVGRNVMGYSQAGKKQWNISLKSLGQSNSYSGANYRLARAHSRGSRHVLWLESRVTVLDVVGDKVTEVWSQGTLGELAKNARLLQMRMMRAQMRGLPSPFPAGDLRPFAVAGDAVVFQSDRRLVAVDIDDGKVLWERNRFSEECDFYGDDQMVLVTPRGAREAVVLSVLDGRELGRREMPPLEERMVTMGRNVLHWTKDGNGRVLKLFDPWTGEDHWRHAYSPKSQPWYIDGLAVVMEPAGDVVVVDIQSGEQTARMKLPEATGLESIYVAGERGHYSLIVNLPLELDDAGVMFGNQFGNQVATAFPVNGRAYGIDFQQAKTLWSATVTNQLLSLDQPTRLPTLVFANFSRRYEQQDNGSMRSISHFQMLVLDKRNGKVLHEEKDKQHRYPYMMSYAADPKTAAITISDQQNAVVIKFDGGAETENKEQETSKGEAVVP